MHNLNLATSVHNYRSQVVDYIPKMTNPVLSRVAAVTVAPLDAAAYLMEQPLNVYQRLGMAISEVLLFLTASDSLENLHSAIENTLIATTNTLSRAITVIPFTAYNLAQAIRNPTALEALDANDGINKLAEDVLDNYKVDFREHFRDSIFAKTVLRRPAALLYVTIDRIANIVNTAFLSLTGLTGGIIETATFGYLTSDNQGSVEDGLIRITVALQLAGICASRIAASPLYLIHHYAMNLFSPPENSYSC